MKGYCEFCRRLGDKISGPEDGLEHDLYVCDICFDVLKDPKTALPFLRGHLSMELRKDVGENRVLNIEASKNYYLNKYVSKFQKGNGDNVSKNIDKFIELMSQLKPRVQN